MSIGFIGSIGTLTPLLDDKGNPKYTKQFWHRIPLFDYKCVLPKLAFYDRDTIGYELDDHFETDGGSIPPSLRLIPFAHLDPFNFTRSYLFHDCGFLYGGLYIEYPREMKFKFRLMTRKQVDKLLKEMLPFDKATLYDTFMIYLGVVIGSMFIWDKTKKPLIQKDERIKNKIDVYDKDGKLIEDNGGRK